MQEIEDMSTQESILLALLIASACNDPRIAARPGDDDEQGDHAKLCREHCDRFASCEDDPERARGCNDWCVDIYTNTVECSEELTAMLECETQLSCTEWVSINSIDNFPPRSVSDRGLECLKITGPLSSCLVGVATN